MFKQFKLLFLLFSSITLLASTSKSENILYIENAWGRPTTKQSTSTAVYLNITNNSDTHDSLIGVSASVATRATINKSVINDKIITHITLGKIAIPANSEVKLKPTGIYIRLVGLKEKLIEGRSFILTLSFEKKGDIRIPVTIKKKLN